MITKRQGLFIIYGCFLITFGVEFVFKGTWNIGKYSTFKGRNPVFERKIQNAALISTRNPFQDIAVARRVWQKYPNYKWRGLQLPLLTSLPGGRLGNFMGGYATLFAISRIYGVTARLHPVMKKQLIGIFPNISMQLIPGHINYSEWIEISYVTFINYGKYEVAAAGLLGPNRFLLTGYPFEIQLFNVYRQDILKEFTFSPDIREKVKNFWIKYNRAHSDVFVGIHVRRKDYLRHIKKLHSSLPELPYLQRAMDYYKAKYSRTKFLVSSDDMNYVKKSFKNNTGVLFTSGSTRELDMALLASCNHSIMTVGSFGFWSSYLAGGNVLYPNITTDYNHQFKKSWYDFGHLDFFIPIHPW